MPSSLQWVFGPFRLDPEHACLWCAAQAIPLPPKVFAVLHSLVTHPDRLVSKDELLAAVWPETAVSDAVVRAAIGALRKVLGDTTQTPRYITGLGLLDALEPLTTRLSPTPGDAGRCAARGAYRRGRGGRRWDRRPPRALGVGGDA